MGSHPHIQLIPFPRMGSQTSQHRVNTRRSADSASTLVTKLTCTDHSDLTDASTSSLMAGRSCPPCRVKREQRLRKIKMLAQAVEIDNHMKKTTHAAKNTMSVLNQWSREFNLSVKNQQHLAALVQKDKARKLKAMEASKDYLKSKAAATS